MPAARAGAAQEADPLAPGVGNDHVLVGVRLLLARVVRGLFFRAFRPLATPLRAVDDQPGILPAGRLALGETAAVALGEDA